MPNGLKYGPKPYVFDDNPEWSRRPPENPMLRPETHAPTPKAYPIDLYHLSQQAFAHDIEAKKRWFLTAFVAPEDQHLLAPPEDTRPARQILNVIKQTLDAPAADCTEPSLQALRDQVVALFKLAKWLGVALQMVDNKALSIDMLNTLIQWQALYIQFEGKFFSLQLQTITNLRANIHQAIYASAELSLEEIKTSTWGITVDSYMKSVIPNTKSQTTWTPTLNSYSHSILSSDQVLTENTLCFRAPSSSLVIDTLLNRNEPSHVIPLYSFGYLAYEDFCAATYLGGRPMQAYLHGAKGNLYWAHDAYYGQALLVHHDYIHASLYRKINKKTFESSMKVLAICANAMARMGNTKLANDLIDVFFFDKLREKLFVSNLNQDPDLDLDTLSKMRPDILKAIYNEFALASGITLSFSCTQDMENKDLFHMSAIHQDQDLSFKVDLSIVSINEQSKYLEDFMKAFEEISTLSTIKIQQQQQRPRWSPTIMLWSMRAAVFSALVGIACLSLGLSGVLNNPIIAGVLLPLIGIASAMVSKWVINPGLVGQGDDMGEVYIEPYAVQPPSLINNKNNNKEQPKPGCFMQYLRTKPEVATQLGGWACGPNPPLH